MQKLEIEKKYLVKFETWDQVFELLDLLTSIKRIEQVYLKPINKEPAVRIRKTIEGFKSKKTYYEINQKIKIKNKENIKKEKEEKISEEEYNKYLKFKDDSKKLIKKNRLIFNYQNQLFELDLFKDHLKGLLILELEVKSENQKPKLPPFIKIVKEITDEDQYNNYNLSDYKITGFKNGKIIRN